jgi:hypothetical protein
MEPGGWGRYRSLVNGLHGSPGGSGPVGAPSSAGWPNTGHEPNAALDDSSSGIFKNDGES